MHQPALLQYLQVLNYRGQSNVEGLCQPRDREGSFAESLHDCPAGGIAESMEDTADVHFLARHGRVPFRRALSLGRQLFRQLF